MPNLNFYPALKKKVVDWLATQLPTARRTIFDVRQMRRLEGGDLDVDRVHEIITSAKNGDITGLFALYLEMIYTGSHLQGRFTERKEAVLDDELTALPVDPENADDVAAAAAIQDVIDNCRDWETACAHLLDSVLYPVSLVEKTFQPSTRTIDAGDGKFVKLSYELSELTPVPYDLLSFMFGTLQLRLTDEKGNPTAEVFDIDDARYITHRGHLLGGPDNFGGPMRAIVFWWLLGHMGRDWWARFLERYGAPFMVGKYDQADDATRTTLMSAFATASRLFGLVVSRDTEIELVEAASKDSGDAFDNWKTVCNEEISKLIGGQTLSSDAKATGMGSGVASSQQEVRQDKRTSDKRRLKKTLRYCLFEQYLVINGLKGRLPRLVWGAEDEDESAATGELLAKLNTAGLEPTDDALPMISERVGFQVQRKAVEPMLGPGLQSLSAPRFVIRADQAQAANDAVVRGAAADLARSLRKAHAPIAQLILRSKTPAEAISRVEAYCAALDPLEASEIIESAMAAMAANGCVAAAR
jgi:phage gp29-like protein